MDKLMSMGVFVRAVERGSFAAAARDLGVSPAMVGKHVRALEDALGVPLLTRTTRQQKLTLVGESYFERCRQVLEDVTTAEQAASDADASPTGLLRINAGTTFGVHALAPTLPVFLDRMPRLTVELTLSDRVVDLIDEGFDVAIRLGRLHASSLRARRLGDYAFVVAAAPDYLARRGTPKSPADLASHDLLGFLSAGAPAPWRFVDASGGAHTVALRCAIASNSGAALRECALAGSGIVVQPRLLLARDLAERRLVEVLRAYRVPPLPIHAVYPAARSVPAKLRVFLDFLAATFGAKRAV